jgi:hypothetical protein
MGVEESQAAKIVGSRHLGAATEGCSLSTQAFTNATASATPAPLGGSLA